MILTVHALPPLLFCTWFSNSVLVLLDRDTSKKVTLVTPGLFYFLLLFFTDLNLVVIITLMCTLVGNSQAVVFSKKPRRNYDYNSVFMCRFGY